MYVTIDFSKRLAQKTLNPFFLIYTDKLKHEKRKANHRSNGAVSIFYSILQKTKKKIATFYISDWEQILCVILLTVSRALWLNVFNSFEYLLSYSEFTIRLKKC